MSEPESCQTFLHQSIQTALTSLGVAEPVATEGSAGHSSARLVSMQLMTQAGKGGGFEQYKPEAKGQVKR